MSVVKNNLMTVKGYSPYCGKDNCLFRWPRTLFNGNQFFCKCGWISNLPDDFIKEYKEKWGLK